MENILELLYDLPTGKTHEQDSPFVRTAKIKYENMEMLDATMTKEQKELLESYFDADAKVQEIIDLERFRYAFHLGAQIMAELIDGKKNVL